MYLTLNKSISWFPQNCKKKWDNHGHKLWDIPNLDFISPSFPLLYVEVTFGNRVQFFYLATLRKGEGGNPNEFLLDFVSKYFVHECSQQIKLGQNGALWCTSLKLNPITKSVTYLVLCSCPAKKLQTNIKFLVSKPCTTRLAIITQCGRQF